MTARCDVVIKKTGKRCNNNAYREGYFCESKGHWWSYFCRRHFNEMKGKDYRLQGWCGI
jgi:hypothetical protein